MDSGHRDLKNILMTISPWTTSDSSWEASAWKCRPRVTISDSDLQRKPQRGCFRLPSGLSIFYIIFFLCILIGLTSLASIYSQTPVLFSSVSKSTLFTPTPFLSLFSQFWTLLFLLKLGPLGATRAQHIS
jgi:hypothetical protein